MYSLLIIGSAVSAFWTMIRICVTTVTIGWRNWLWIGLKWNRIWVSLGTKHSSTTNSSTGIWSTAGGCYTRTVVITWNYEEKIVFKNFERRSVEKLWPRLQKKICKVSHKRCAKLCRLIKDQRSKNRNKVFSM